MNKFGIDVSHYQLDIDWKQVPSSGIKFAIMKAMYESSHRPDEYFENNYRGCRNNNIKTGAYIFIGTKSVINPREDAISFLEILNGRKLEYGIWLDLESKNIRAFGKDALSRVIIQEASIFEQAGYNVGIYTNLDWYKNVIDFKMFTNVYPIWCARYPKIDTGVMIPELSPKSFANAWQYSSKGQVPGIIGNVDMDVDYNVQEFFRNHRIALEVLAGKWGSAQTTPTRKQRLEKEGYSYEKVQAMVNAIFRIRRFK